MFDNYNHFKRYCWAICRNKDIVLSINQINIFNQFESVNELLKLLVSHKKIEDCGNLLDRICELCKKSKVEYAVLQMEYVLLKLERFNKGEIFFNSVISAINQISSDIFFTSEFIQIKNIDDKFFPRRVRVLRKKVKLTNIYELTSIGNNTIGCAGVYFIYDNEDVLAYIGRSTTSVYHRSLNSAESKLSSNFSRIDILQTSNKSEACIYELYYISKYKPYQNKDSMFDDESLKINLPDLELTQTLSKIKIDEFDLKVKYNQMDSMDVFDFLNTERYRVTLNNKYELSNSKHSSFDNYYDAEANKMRLFERDVRDGAKKYIVSSTA